MYFGQALLISMNQGFGKVCQMFVQLGNGFGIISTEQDLFPQILGRMRSFYGLHVQVDTTVFFSNGSVFGIGQRTRGSIAEARYGIRVFAKVGFVTFGLANGRFEGTKLVIDHTPYHFIVLHFGKYLVLR